jgi:hypothetical protein
LVLPGIRSNLTSWLAVHGPRRRVLVLRLRGHAAQPGRRREERHQRRSSRRVRRLRRRRADQLGAWLARPSPTTATCAGCHKKGDEGLLGSSIATSRRSECLQRRDSSQLGSKIKSGTRCMWETCVVLNPDSSLETGCCRASRTLSRCAPLPPPSPTAR